jgi:hypothetical protein
MYSRQHSSSDQLRKAHTCWGQAETASLLTFGTTVYNDVLSVEA